LHFGLRRNIHHCFSTVSKKTDETRALAERLYELKLASLIPFSCLCFTEGFPSVL